MTDQQSMHWSPQCLPDILPLHITIEPSTHHVINWFRSQIVVRQQQPDSIQPLPKAQPPWRTRE
jgi:hypothetical protein